MIGVETVMLVLFLAPIVSARLGWGQGYRAGRRDATRAWRDHGPVSFRDGEGDQ